MDITTFLMFEGQAEAAMNLYVSLFPDSKIVSDERFGPDEMGPEGTIKHAIFELNGTRYACIDSAISHGFTFTPSMSLYVNCDSREQLDGLFEALSAEGSVMMPPANYGFSSWFVWLQDRFGVSWQLNLP